MPYLVWFVTLLIVALVASCVLAACQPVPRPFQPETKSAADFAGFTGVADKLGIFVAGIDNAPAGLDRAVVGALVEGLHSRDIAASDRVANRASYLLIGTARPDAPDGLVIAWRLIDSDGLVIGLVDQHLGVDDAAWRRGDPALAAAIADQAAPRLAAVIADVAPAGPAPRTRSPGAVILAEVEGARGEGDAELTRAMRAALERLGIAVVDTPGAAHPIVRGQVLRRPRGADELVEIRWSVEAPDGGELGRIGQSNLVPAGSLDGDWGPVARAVADGAAEGVRALLDELAHAPK